MTTTLDRVQQLANQLSALDQVRLIEYLSRQIAPVLTAQAVERNVNPSDDAWAKLARLRAELAGLPADHLASEQLTEDRAGRQIMLEGTKRVHT
ncbi:MAG: hypothetical protein SH847_03720 [Roseiflexaceae bacterium]|nr:hypothetical protein [Roseiflexaceae bacterium]